MKTWDPSGPCVCVCHPGCGGDSSGVQGWGQGGKYSINLDRAFLALNHLLGEVKSQHLCPLRDIAELGAKPVPPGGSCGDLRAPSSHPLTPFSAHSQFLVPGHLYVGRELLSVQISPVTLDVMREHWQARPSRSSCPDGPVADVCHCCGPCPVGEGSAKSAVL